MGMALSSFDELTATHENSENNLTLSNVTDYNS